MPGNARQQNNPRAPLGHSTTMAESNTSIHNLFAALDPKSLILSQFSDSEKLNLLQLTTEGFFMERGLRYKAYADFREPRLRFKFLKDNPPLDYREFELTLPKKQVKFQGNSIGATPNRRKGSSVLTQSVPDFSVVLRKENRKPRSTMLPPLMEKSATLPSKLYGIGAKSSGSKSVNAGEKRGRGLLMARKSIAGVEELKGLSSASSNAINGENRGGGRKTILGYRQGYLV